MLRVRINQDLCIGAGLCVLSSAEVFDQRDEDGVVVLRQEFPPEQLHAAVKGAARKCPALAITVEEHDGAEPAGSPN